MLTTGRSDLAEGALDVVLEGQAEQVTDDAEFQPVADHVRGRSSRPVRGTSLSARGRSGDRDAGGRVIEFRVRPVRGLGFRKGDRFSQTTWRGFR